MSNLSSQQFDPQYGDGLYHGTFREIGDTVKPASQTSHKAVNFKGLSKRDRAYATENEDTAWELAGNAVSRYPWRDKGTPQPRTRVYEVEAHPEMAVGEYHPDSDNFQYENLSEWTAPEFKVKNTIDIRPERQGTFPLNWNQFASRQGGGVGDEYNHPSDHDIEHGHNPHWTAKGERKYQSIYRDTEGEAAEIQAEIRNPKYQDKLF